MKKNILGLSLCAIALSGLLFVSCDKEGKTVEVLVNVPTLTVTSSVTVSAAGGQYNFSYSVTNAADDGVVTAAGNASWISDVTVASGSISFNIAENTSASVRTGQITVTYSYTEDGSAKSVYEYVGVVQNGATAPVLYVQPNAVTADYAGGTYSFDYEVTDAVEDGEIACTVDQTWVSNFDYSSYGTVSFDVEANEDETLRTATITVTYTYSGNKLEKEVTVIQDHQGGDSGNGGDGGNGSIEDVIGTYTASGRVNGQTISDTETTWTLKILKYTGSDGAYDLDIDAIVPWAESYDAYGDNRMYVAANLVNGQIVIPSQALGRCTINTTTGASYYLGFTACTKYDSGSYYYSSTYPSTTLTYDSSTGVWTSDYGVFGCGCTSQYDITTMYTYFQASAPGFTITKTSSSYDVPDNNVSAGNTTENVKSYNAYKAE